MNYKHIMLGLGLAWAGLATQPAEAQGDKRDKPSVGNEKDRQFVLRELDEKHAAYCQTAKEIWKYAELGYREEKSSALLQSTLRNAGFTIEAGVAGIPTAFVASYGSGKPVIGILAEFDALPGLSQDTVPYRKPLTDGASGHGCGHNLFGTASSAAAIALKNWLLANKKAGTVRLYGTPAEEGGGGKVYMVRAGLFSDVDAVLHWHPGDRNNASASTCLANKSASFKFYGKTSHAAAAPEKGRSALDGVEAMNYMVNLMREHVPQEARIHYVIKNGGLASNVVPDYAEVEYTVRHPSVQGTQELWERLLNTAEGAAKGTGTTFKYEIQSGLYNLLPNETLARLVYANLVKVGGVSYTPAELDFAQKIQSSFDFTPPPLALAQTVQPYKLGFFPASTDVGDVSWVVPTAGLNPATWVPGTAAHTWQATAANGMSIGYKGMAIAAKVIALTGIELFNSPALLAEAKQELIRQRGADFQYKPLIGDIKPPLNYRQGLAHQ
jgi:aminobenzoyl-glutamate utilization protein B